MTCTCHPQSPFLWRNDKRESIFVNKQINQYARLSATQSAVVERERNAGRDISHIAGLSRSDNAQRMTDARRFTVYSKAGNK